MSEQENKISESSKIGNNIEIPTIDGSCSGEVTNAFNAGYTTAEGEIIILVSSVWQKADANNADRFKGKLGIALQVQTVGKKMLAATKGLVYCSTWNFTPNADVYIDENAGLMVQDVSGFATDSAVRKVGHAISATLLDLNPSADYLTVA